MLPTDLLYLLAEISAVFLGFSIIASSIKRDGFDSVRLLGIITCASWIMVGVFTPFLMISFGFEEDQALRIGAIAVIAANGFGWFLQNQLAQWGEAITHWKTMAPTFLFEAAIWLPMLLVIFDVTSTSGALYLLALLALFAQTLTLIIAMVISPDSE